MYYRQKSLVVNRKTEYPVPSGVYMARIIELTRTLSPREDALVDLITDIGRVGRNAL